MPLEKYIIEQIATNSISPLDLGNKQIGDAEAKALAEALKTNHLMTYLYLYSNQIGDAGVQALAEALKTNHTIATLLLYTNKIGNVGVQALAEALKINKTIATLYLYSNQIGDAGAQALAEALQTNYTITHLDIRYNKIGDAGTQALAEALKFNKAITYFYIDTGNPIGPVGVRYLADALKINKSIVSFGFGFENIGNIVKQEIEAALQINKNFPAEAKKEALAQQIAEQTRQEAERLEQEAKQKEQEEAKAVREAARLKAIEEAKIKEYIPNIPAVKLFEIEDEDNQFNNDEQATIQQVSSLIRDGNDHLQERGKKAVLVIGNTRAGKSTLTHALAGRKLQAIFDNETEEFVIDAKQPLNDIVIGHKMASESKIPNKCVAKDTTIWDCPGFNDTELVQEIANRFYIKRLFETTEQLKFVLVVDESYLRSNRGSDFLETLSNFIKSFNDIESIEGSISLIFTHVPPNKNIQHIKNSIDKILRDNQRATDEHKALINKLKDGDSIHLFHRPTDEGELTIPDLLAEIDSSSKYSDVKGEMVNITISKKAKECSVHLLNTASNNFNQLLEVIVKAIGNATKCLNVNPLNAFSENYHLVKDWIPSSINYHELKQHNEGEYFLELELLSRLQQVFSKPIDSISTAIINLQIAVDIFAEYAESDNSQLKHQIQEYGYCLQQQYDYVLFFSDVCKAELPDHAKIAELITTCHTKVTENLEYQVSSLPIDKNQSDPAYYHEALKYLKNYQDSPACKNLKAIAYSCLATIAEKDGGNEAASVYYVKAIEANSHLPEIYEKLGQLFFNKGEYAKAINCYKVVNNAFRIKECFKAWLKQDKENPDIMLQQAEYFESIGLFEQAKKYYHHAFSLSHDENFKVAAYKKISKIMDNVAAQGQNFATRADEHNLYNYELVNEEFTNNLLGVDLKFDLYL